MSISKRYSCPGMSLVQEERLAFMLCEADGEEGLTWTEVEDCEVEKHFGEIFDIEDGVGVVQVDHFVC